MLNLSGMGPADLMELLTEKCEVHDWTFMMANGNAYYKGLAKSRRNQLYSWSVRCHWF